LLAELVTESDRVNDVRSDGSNFRVFEDAQQCVLSGVHLAVVLLPVPEDHGNNGHIVVSSGLDQVFVQNSISALWQIDSEVFGAKFLLHVGHISANGGVTVGVSPAVSVLHGVAESEKSIDLIGRAPPLIQIVGVSVLKRGRAHGEACTCVVVVVTGRNRGRGGCWCGPCAITLGRDESTATAVRLDFSWLTVLQPTVGAARIKCPGNTLLVVVAEDLTFLLVGDGDGLVGKIHAWSVCSVDVAKTATIVMSGLRCLGSRGWWGRGWIVPTSIDTSFISLAVIFRLTTISILAAARSIPFCITTISSTVLAVDRHKD